MPMFHITQSEHHAVTYEVEAANAEEAEAVFREGLTENNLVRDEIVATDVVIVEPAP